jgi:hypothetical protein
MNDVLAQITAAAKCFARDTFQKFTTETGEKIKTYRGSTRINADRDAKYGSNAILRSLHFSAFQSFVMDQCLRPADSRLGGDILRPVNQQQQSGMAKAPAILLLLAMAIFLAGALRYYRLGTFTLAQAGYCLAAVLVSLVALLVFDYTLHHARIVAVMVLVFVVLFLVASPSFCVGMGLGLAGMVVVQGRV